MKSFQGQLETVTEKNVTFKETSINISAKNATEVVVVEEYDAESAIDHSRIKEAEST